MKAAQFYASLQRDRSLLETLEFNPYYQQVRGLNSGQPLIRSERYYDLASNDYLGLASDGRIHQAMVHAVREYGSSQCGTPIATGYAPLMAEVESELARFIGVDAALVFPSCYQANLALFSSIATPADVIIPDHYVHASLGYGIKAVGCKVKPFLHNNLEHLEKQLAAASGFRQRFVVTESVFSTEGSVAPFDEIVALCRRYDAIPIVDDSHGIGVLGRNGRGILEQKRLEGYEGIYTASLGKALGNFGGVVAGPSELIEALRYCCPGLIYSTALPPACLGGIRQSLSIVRGEFIKLGVRLWQNHQLLVEHLQQLGLEVSPADAPIAAVRCGSTEETIRLTKSFFEQRLLGTPFVPPSVPEGQGVLRLIVGAKLDDTQMEEMLEALSRVNSGVCA